MFVTIEGIDGAGKTTVMSLLKDEFKDSVSDPDDLRESDPPEYVFTREPTTSWLGDSVRRSINDDDSVPLTDLFLFVADHADHIERVIKPALDKGAKVICDRYVDSRYAYQSVTVERYFEDIDTAGSRNNIEWIKSLQEEWTVQPDLTLLLDISPEEALRRKEFDDKMKYERLEFLEDVRDNYSYLAREEPDRFVVVDAERRPEEITQECIGIIESR